MKIILVCLLFVFAASAKATPATFTNRVWVRADSTGKANGDRYTFLSDGTFIITSPFGNATFGRWNRQGNEFKIYENNTSYDATVASLTTARFRLRVDQGDRILEIPLMLVGPTEPDSVQRFQGFNPNAFQIGAGGSEPGWSFVVEGGRARMSRPGKTLVEHVEYQGTWKRVDYYTWVFTGNNPKENESAVLTITEGPTPCTEAAGDYVMDARLKALGSDWAGCAWMSRFLK